MVRNPKKWVLLFWVYFHNRRHFNTKNPIISHLLCVRNENPGMEETGAEGGGSKKRFYLSSGRWGVRAGPEGKMLGKGSVEEVVGAGG